MESEQNAVIGITEPGIAAMRALGAQIDAGVERGRAIWRLNALYEAHKTMTPAVALQAQKELNRLLGLCGLEVSDGIPETVVRAKLEAMVGMLREAVVCRLEELAPALARCKTAKTITARLTDTVDNAIAEVLDIG